MMQKQFYKTALNRLRSRLKNGEDLGVIALASESLLVQTEPHEPDIPDHISKELLARI
jgi:hypothetical protein